MKSNTAKKRVPSNNRSSLHAAGRQPLDNALVREMREAYRVLNIEKERERIRASRNRTPTQAFDAFLELWEFGRQFVERDVWAQKDKVESCDRYYKRLKKIEAGRRSRAG